MVGRTQTSVFQKIEKVSLMVERKIYQKLLTKTAIVATRMVVKKKLM